MTHVAILARYPVPGQAKTRLTPSLPEGLAALLHRAMVEDALESALEAGADRVTIYWAAEPPGPSQIALPAGVAARAQTGPDLGARIASAFAELLTESTARVVVIGTDCPDLDSETIRQGLALLVESDLVVGPARDGGYYLIGLRRATAALFAGIEWGSSRVLQETLERARRLELSTHSLGMLEDVDTPADLVRLIARRSIAESTVGLRAESALREMGLLPTRG